MDFRSIEKLLATSRYYFSLPLPESAGGSAPLRGNHRPHKGNGCLDARGKGLSGTSRRASMASASTATKSSA